MVFDHSNGKVAKVQLQPRHRENFWRKSKCLKVPKDQQKVCYEIVFYMRRSCLHQSYQYGCLNKAWTMTMPADIPFRWGNFTRLYPLLKSYKQSMWLDIITLHFINIWRSSKIFFKKGLKAKIFFRFSKKRKNSVKLSTIVRRMKVSDKGANLT